MTISKTIGIVATGSGARSQEIEHIESTLRQWGCDVCFTQENLLGQQSSPHRANTLLDQLRDDRIDAIWILRGGEGSSDLIPYLHQSFDLIHSLHPKPIMGLSDATAVLVYMHQLFKWPCTYMSGAISLAKSDQYDEASLQVLRQFIVSGRQASVDDLIALNDHALQSQQISSEVCVGNMSLLAISIKDLWEFDADNKVLVIEDWHEKGYVVDRTMKYFKRIGKLDAIKALIFGDMMAGRFSADDVEQQRQMTYMEKVLKRFAKTISVPVLSTRYIGHGPYQTPITMGHTLNLQCGLKPILVQQSCDE